MRSLVIYDSQFGNTEKIAKAIAEAVPCDCILVSKIMPNTLNEVKLLIIGSPTQGGMATKPIQELIKSITNKNLSVAVFDTRFAFEGQPLPLKLLMKTIGFASPKMAKALSNQGFRIIGNPEGFYVNGKEGEIERSKNWAISLTI